jgi:hypothetical protein
MLALGIWSFRSTHHTLNSKNLPKNFREIPVVRKLPAMESSLPVGRIARAVFLANPAKTSNGLRFKRWHTLR